MKFKFAAHGDSTVLESAVPFLYTCFFFSEEVDRLARELKMRLFRTSVKEDLNVRDVFGSLAENYVAKVRSFGGDSDGSEDPAAQLARQLNLIQIGIGSRPYVTKNNSGNNARSRSKVRRINNNHVVYNNNNNNSNGSVTYTHWQNRYHHQHQSGGGHRQRYGGRQYSHGGVGGGFSPQDYLNNPMFDRLHAHNRYWSRPSRDDGVVTLRPLSAIAKKSSSGHQRKGFSLQGHNPILGGRGGACKVL